MELQDIKKKHVVNIHAVFMYNHNSKRIIMYQCDSFPFKGKHF